MSRWPDADSRLLESQLEVISISVPEGLAGGDNVQFHEGDGIFSALIPPGLKAGDSFKVSVAGGHGARHRSNDFQLANKPHMETVRIDLVRPVLMGFGE